MNTMKKWLAAGLIGLVSTGMAWAAPLILDSFDSGTYSPTMDPLASSGGVNSMAWAWNSDLSIAYTGYRNNNMVGDPEVNPFSFSGGTVTFDANTANGYNPSLTYSVGSVVDGVPSEYGSLAGWSGISIGWVNDTTENVLMALTIGYIDNTVYKWAATQISSQSASYNFGAQFWSDPYAAGPQFALSSDNLAHVWQVQLTFDAGQPSATGTVGLDYIQLNEQGVPEPETVWMIVAVLASLGVTFRRQLMDFAGRCVKT